MRAWLRTEQAGGWLKTISDPRLGRAITAIHDHPEHPWTVQELAREASMSRAAFAAAFKARVGQPPLAYLTAWRMIVAADGLARRNWSITRAAQATGYSSDQAFTRVFQRHLGTTPATYRRAHPARSHP